MTLRRKGIMRHGLCLFSHPKGEFAMKSRFFVMVLVVASLLDSTACFSYKKQVNEPPPSSTTVVQPANPTSSTTSQSSTTIDSDGNTVERNRSTTTITPGY